MAARTGEEAGVAILVAEDDPTQAERLRAVLEDAGYQVEMVGSGTEALAAARHRVPAVVISDVVMPEMDGFELCKAIKSDEKLRETPVVLLTSLTSSLDIVKGLECGADNFIRKPYDDAYLLSRLRYLLANRELRGREKTRIGVKIELGGQRQVITSDRQQILDLLISTYEQAVQVNNELQAREKDLTRSQQVLRGIYRIAEGLNHATSEREVAETALEGALDLPGVRAGWIALREGEATFRIAATRGLPPALAAPGAFDGNCLCRRLCLSGELDHVTNVLECERLKSARGDTGGLRYHATVPLWTPGRTLGVMNLAGPEQGLFSDDDIEVLYGVGNLVGVALERAQLLDGLEAKVEDRTSALRAESAERARAEEALRKSEILFRSVFNSQTDAVVVVTPERTVVNLNPATEAMFGHTLEDLEGRSTEVLHVDHEHYLRFGEIFREAFAGRRAGRFEFEMRRKNADVFPTENTISLLEDDLGRPTGIVAVVRDITERRQAEDALRRAEERYRGIFENAVVGIYRTTIEGRYVTANPTLARTYGYESSEELMTSLTDLARRFYVQSGRREEFVRLAEARGAVREFESQVFRKDGSVIWISEDARELRDAEGRLVGFEGTTVDITARKLAEQERERLAAVLDATPDFVAVGDPQGRVLYLNRAARTLMGIGPDEDSSGVRTADGHAEWARKVVLETGIPTAVRDGVWKGETAFLDREGREVPFSQVIVAHKGPDGEVAFLSTIARDISEQRSLETQLRQVQKMEAIGQLAGGVAHDFNNILGVVTGYAEILLRRLPQGDPLCRHAREIEKAAQRAAGLTRQLLAFSRKQALHLRPLDLNAVVTGMEGMLRRLIGEDVDLVTVLGPDVPLVMADPGQVEQVILNLAANARDAMPDGGRLTIETAEIHLGEAYARDHPDVRPGPYTMLALSDTGEGIDEATRARIFEPFFTTKEPGKGTGMGLATVYGIVKQSGGHVSVYSEPAQGTTFKVYLPQVPETAEAAVGETGSSPAEASGGVETLLVVEDEEALRAMIREILEAEGYTVLQAPDGAGALAVAEAHAGPIHLLVTDVVMPRLNGRELFERLGALRPGLRCVFMSGYTGHAALRNGTLPEGQGFLDKPFTRVGLLRQVREALHARSSSATVRQK